jgi:hypothetical protein
MFRHQKIRPKKNPAAFRVRGLHGLSSLTHAPAPAVAKQYGKALRVVVLVHLSQLRCEPRMIPKSPEVVNVLWILLVLLSLVRVSYY